MIQKERIVICLTCKKKYYVTEDQDGIIDSLEVCKKCKTKTVDAHYKFIKIRDAPNSDNFFKDN